MKVKQGIVLTAFVLLSLPSFAKDANNQYTVKGAGASRCSAYVEAFRARQSDRIIAYAAWIDGYLSFHNKVSEDTFDIAPWQSSEFLTRAIFTHCQKKPELTVFTAVEYMVAALQEQRLESHSELVSIKNNGKTHYFYKAIIVDVQSALNRLQGAELPENGVYDDALKAAITVFQRENGLKANGFLDQQTLQRVLRSVNQAD